MDDEIRAHADGGVDPSLAQRVDGNPLALRVRLCDRRAQLRVADLVLRGRVHGIRQPSGDTDLDQVGAVRDVVANPPAERLGAAHADAVEVAGAARDAEPWTRRHDAWTFDTAGGDRVAQADVCIGGRPEVLHRGEAGCERRPRVRGRIAAEREVHVSVDEPWQDGRRGQLHDRRACGSGDGSRGSGRHDPSAVHDDHSVLDRTPFLDIDHPLRLEHERRLLPC